MLSLVLTGRGRDEDRQRSREAGFNGHLVKSMEYDTLMELLAMSDDQLTIKTPDSPDQYPSEKRL
jgi:CheY-like chemotaxis protein